MGMVYSAIPFLLFDFMIKNKFLLIILLGIILFGCSASEETFENSAQKLPEILVFEEVDKLDSTLIKEDTLKNEMPKPMIDEKTEIHTINATNKQLKYIIQVGAFSTMERADAFIKENQQKINNKMVISFNEQTKLYAVQFTPVNEREYADQIRNSINQISAFKDAFIITIEE
jgi:cell division protein FtsN